MKEAPTSGPRGLPDFLAAYAHRGFRLLWAGAFLSSVGTWIQDVALSWLIHSRMGDPFYLGLRSFAQEVPLLAFMLLGGAVADRIDRRLILLSSQWFQMAMALLLGALYLTGHLGIVAIVLIAFATGLMQSQSAPTYQAVITSLVPRDRIANAVALNSLQFNLSRAIGPVVAGLLLAHAGAGLVLCRERALVHRGHPRPADDRVPPARRRGPARACARASWPGLRHVKSTPAAAVGDPLRRRRELPGLPAHHLPAGDRGRRAQDRRLRLQPAADQRRHRRDRGRGRHRPSRPRRRPGPADAPRLRRLRRS